MQVPLKKGGTGGMFIRMLQNPMKTSINLPPVGSVEALLARLFQLSIPVESILIG